MVSTNDLDYPNPADRHSARLNDLDTRVALLERLGSGASSGPMSGFRNKIINGDFRVWQRGGGAFTGNGTKTADMWGQAVDAIGGTMSSTLQLFTPGNISLLSPTPTDEPIAFHRTVVTVTSNANSYAQIFNRVEGVRSLAGQTVTLSFWAKANATKRMAIELQQFFGAGGSPSSPVLGIGGQSFVVGTTWQRYSFTIQVPSITGKTLGSNGGDNLTAVIWFSAGSAFLSRVPAMVENAGTFDVWGVQLEQGAGASSFEHRHSGIEQALCHRYFYRQNKRLHGIWISSTAARFVAEYPVPMFRAPTPSLFTTTPYMEIWNLAVISGTASLANNANGILANDFTLTLSGISGGTPAYGNPAIVDPCVDWDTLL